MAINFSNENLIKISCDNVENDAHPIKNLISNCANLRKNGFLVEYYIRPPITIIIDFFKYNFDLMFLELGLNLRSHRSNGIELWIKNLYNDNDVLIGKYNQTPDNLTIVNGAYRPNRSLPLETMNPKYSNAFYISGKNWKYCSHITQIKIKITSTLNSTVPCLSFLNIYGKPSSGLNKEQMKEFSDFCDEYNNKHCDATKKKTDKVDPGTLESLAPIEFFDSLTCELMSMPYLLPSGHNVDQKTLNRLDMMKNNQTAIDPFTKIPFTQTYQPRFNDQLKMQIDLFIQTNGQSEIDKRNELRKRLNIK